MSTLFERIIAGEIPSKKLYEDDKVIAIMDINPIQKGHALVITKQPCQRMEECDDETISHAFVIVKRMMKHMKKTLGCDYVHVIVEGVEVPHFHIHLVPSLIGVKNAQRHHTSYDDGEMDTYYEKLRLQ